MRIRTLGIALAVLAVGTFAFAGEYTTSDLRMIGEGRALYLTNCSGCHGAALKGAEALAPKAPGLSALVDRDGGFSRTHVASHIRFGSSSLAPWPAASPNEPREMPAWGTMRTFGEHESFRMLAIAKLTRYLEWAQTPTSVASTR